MNAAPNILLYTRKHRVRYIYKIIAFSTLLGGFAVLYPFLPQRDAFQFEYFTFGLILVSTALIKIFEKRPVATLGLAWNAFTTRQFYWGIAVGAGMISFAIAAMELSGFARLALPLHTWQETVLLCSRQFVYFLFAAAVEELVFRGYLYQAAIESSNTTVATVVFSVLFAAAHGMNPGVGALAYVNIFLAGLFLAAAYLRTRQLWLPIALHASWNFFQGTIYGADVSGESLGGHILSFTSDGPAWITGGSFGPEAGIVATLALILGIAAVNIAPQFRISPEQYALMHRVRYAEDYALLRSAQDAA